MHFFRVIYINKFTISKMHTYQSVYFNLCNEMVVKIAVLGAGINGLSCAVKIKQMFKDSKMVIIGREFSPNTTGDGAGGLWNPYLCGTTEENNLTKWGIETYSFLHRLWLEGGYHVCLMPCFNLYLDKERQTPHWADVVFGYRTLDEKNLKYLNGLYSAEFAAGHSFSSFVFTPTSVLNHLLELFKSLNGETIEGTISSLEDPILDQFDVVVNCLGLGAQTVVPDDRVHPIRGQITKVIAPWVNESIIDVDGGNYIIPRVDACVLGGTHQEHDHNKSLYEEDTAFILNGCQSMVPSLKHAKLLTHWVGLRPGRDEIRLQAEQRNGKLFIHNYGHGGSGLTLFWGCATEVLQLLEKNINDKYMCKL